MSSPEEQALEDERASALRRPHPHLLTMYVFTALMALLAAPIVFVPLLIRYHTLRYRLDEEGVSASWGIFFRREIYLTYRRIQDIHVKRNLFERWLGIARVELQTASGSAGAELTLEGLEYYESIRNFLYRRMRGAKAGTTVAEEEAPGERRDLAGILLAIRDEVERARTALEASSKEA